MEKQNVINRLNTGLKHEKLAYKIYGIVALVLAIIVMVCGSFMFVSSAVLTEEDASTNELSFNSKTFSGNTNILFENDRVEIADDDVHILIDNNEVETIDDVIAVSADAGEFAFGIFYITYGAVYLAVAIVNLVMASKIGKYRLSDEATVKHASSVGSIVLAALFNEIALVFVIINFVIAKKNREVLEG